MKLFRHIGSMVFVLGLFTALFAGIPWYVIVADDPVIPWWLRMAIFCFLGGKVAAAAEVREKAEAKEMGAANETTHSQP